MNYQITITKREPNLNYKEQAEAWNKNNHWNRQDNPVPQEWVERGALSCELTEKQFEAVKAAVLKEFI